MNNDKLISLIDELCAQASETELLEFKSNYSEAEQLGKNLSALANSACIRMQSNAYLVYGVEDKTHEVIGTDFNPHVSKAKGNQDILPWLSSLLHPNFGFEVYIAKHPNGNVVIFEIKPARGQPVKFQGKAYIRDGSSTTELAKYPEKERMIWTLPRDWSGEICEEATLTHLDPVALQHARREFAARHIHFSQELDNWDDISFLSKLKLMRENKLTNAAILLLGYPEAEGLLTPAVARISWILRGENNEDLDYIHMGTPFILIGDELLKYIRNLKVRIMTDDSITPVEIPRYDPWVLREALHNCIAHQDYFLGGRISVLENPHRVIFTNVGSFLPGNIETVIHRDAPHPIYRNPLLAEAMTVLGMIDSRGGGIKRMFTTQQKRAFPLPDYDLNDPQLVHVTIHGSILDHQYTQLLLKRTDYDLDTAILLDKVQKRLSISQEDHQRLKQEGLVEGRYPNLLVAGPISRAVGEAGRHIRDRGFDNKYYLDLILELVGAHGPVRRSWINDVLMPKLPDRLSEEQKSIKISNLIQELRRSGRIVNIGGIRNSSWILGDEFEKDIPMD